jgi:hypothetical protein
MRVYRGKSAEEEGIMDNAGGRGNIREMLSNKKEKEKMDFEKVKCTYAKREK